MIKRHKLIFLLILFGLFFLIIGVGLTAQYVGRVRHQPFPQRRETNLNLIEPWMTLPYVAHVYRIPEPELFEQLSVNPQQRRKSLEEIAKDSNIEFEVFIQKVKTVVSDFQTGHPIPPTPRL